MTKTHSEHDRRASERWFAMVTVFASLSFLSGCSSNSAGSGATGGSESMGGTVGSGGIATTGGSAAMGGSSGSGGTTALGGTTSSATGGTIRATGGVIASGGSASSGGTTGSGGATSSGGAIGSGGAAGRTETGGSITGGATNAGGVTGSGGATNAGGVTGSGGAPGSGGAAGRNGTGGGATGGANGGTGGQTGTGGVSSGTGGAGNAGGPSYPYILSCFNDDAAVSALQIYTSNDAVQFTLLADTGYAGPTGNLRDPSILKHTDGMFYVAFTTPPPGTGCCGSQTSFSIASSSDLKKWTTLTTVPSGIAGVTNVWAPDWYKDTDGTLHILVSIAVNGGGKKSYRYEPTDSTLTKWSGGTFIGIGPNNIDTFIVKVGATYHAFTKNEDTKYIEHATATTIDGPWNFGADTGNWAGWGDHREGPALLDLGNGKWRMFCDGYGSGYEMYSDSSDAFKTWTPLKALPGVGRISHGAVIKGN